MKYIEVIDCNDDLHQVNCEFVYKLTIIEPYLAEKRRVVCIHLNHKDDNYSFEVIKTFEQISTLRLRLESCSVK